MKVLAKRYNGAIWMFSIAIVLFVICTYIVVSCFGGYYEANGSFNGVLQTSDFEAIKLLFGYVFIIIVTVVSLVGTVKTLFLPKVLMEYDDYGIYIYHKYKPTKTIRFEDICSEVSEEDTVDIYVGTSYYYHKISHKVLNNTLRIEVEDGFVRVDCVEDVKNVELKIRQLVRSTRKSIIEELEENVEENRMKELEEHTKT